MKIHSIKINRQTHATLLADHREDPVTKELLKVGDEVCVCAVCKTVYLKVVWTTIMANTCCNQRETLRQIPGMDFSSFGTKSNSIWHPIEIWLTNEPKMAILGRSTDLIWEVKNARRVALYEDDSFFEVLPAKGRKRIYPQSASKYTLKASNALEELESNLIIRPIKVPQINEITLPKAPPLELGPLNSFSRLDELNQFNPEKNSRKPLRHFSKESWYQSIPKFVFHTILGRIDRKNLIHLVRKTKLIKKLPPSFKGIFKTL